MEFRNIVIGSELYGENLTLAPLEENINYERLSSRYSEGIKPSYNFDSRTLNYELCEDDKEGTSKATKKQLIELIFIMIATCHECVPTATGF